MAGFAPRPPYADVQVDFGAGPQWASSTTQVLDLRSGLVPVDGPVDWSQLDNFPSVHNVLWSGPDRGVSEAIAGRGVQYFEWSDPVGDLDLTGTALVGVRVTGPGACRIRLPGTVTTLWLFDTSPELEAHAHRNGHWIDVRTRQLGSSVTIPAGLRDARTVWLTVGGSVSATVVDPLTDLRHLTLGFDAPPGTLLAPEALARHPGLETLELDDAYGLDPATLPIAPALRSLTLNGVRRATATAIGERLKGGPVDLTIRGAKSETWLAAHLDNPFRDWVEESKTFGRKACAAWARAVRIGAGNPEAALRGLVADLSTLNDTTGLVDTLYREQVWDAFLDLAGRLSVPQEQADAWFDEGRRF